jgi:hypothetical protein
MPAVKNAQQNKEHEQHVDKIETHIPIVTIQGNFSVRLMTDKKISPQRHRGTEKRN